MQVEPYLHFDGGNCEAALNFYKAVFGGEIGDIMRYGDAQTADQVPPEAKNGVMHSSFKAPGVAFMASDSFRGDFPERGLNARVRLSIGSSDAAEGQRIFDALATGGAIHEPYAKQFWGASFGMLTDKYGIDWMVNAG